MASNTPFDFVHLHLDLPRELCLSGTVHPRQRMVYANEKIANIKTPNILAQFTKFNARQILPLFGILYTGTSSLTVLERIPMWLTSE